MFKVKNVKHDKNKRAKKRFLVHVIQYRRYCRRLHSRVDLYDKLSVRDKQRH